MIRTRAVHRDGPPRLPSHSKHTKKADSPIRVGIVGLGRAGFGMQTQELLARPDTYEIVAGCDLSPRQRRRFKGKVPGAAVYARAEDLFADPRVELVSIATRTPTHAALSIAALRAGKLVMDEKLNALAGFGYAAHFAFPTTMQINYAKQVFPPLSASIPLEDQWFDEYAVAFSVSSGRDMTFMPLQPILVPGPRE